METVGQKMNNISYVAILSSMLPLGIALTFADEESQQDPFPPMPDPRPLIYRTFSVGQEAAQTLCECIIIIAWAHPPKGSDQIGYQIWGDDRIITHEQLSASLRSLFKASEGWAYQPHILVIGNDWGAGRELDPLMKAISKAHRIDTYYYGASYLFREVAFRAEAGNRRKMIVAAVDAGKRSSGQGGVDQPATAPKSKVEGDEKPESESEERPR